MSAWTVLQGDAIELLATVPAANVDAIVTDPPYGIGIDGQSWDGPDIQEAAALADREHLAPSEAHRIWSRL